MVDPNSRKRSSTSAANPSNSDQYARLKAELQAPYRPLRQFIYFGLGASGFIGAIVFLAQLLAGRDVATAFPNFALQVGLVALMIGLFRWEQRSERK
jgi:hypothetical protein